MPSIQKTLRILDFIAAYQQVNRRAPTLRTIGAQFGLRSVGSVHRHIAIMQDRGWIWRAPYNRNIQIIKSEQKRAA